MLLNFVMATMFIVLPAFGSLRWLGRRSGRQRTAGPSEGSKSAGQAGSREPAPSSAVPGSDGPTAHRQSAGLDRRRKLIVVEGTALVLGLIPDRPFLTVGLVMASSRPSTGNHDKREKYRQPERDIGQHTEGSELDGQQRSLGSARRPSSREQPALRPPIQTRAASPGPAHRSAEAFCESGLCGGLHGGYLMFILSCGCDTCPCRD